MDKSEIYIKMCEKAKEIQIYKIKIGGLREGDYLFDGKKVRVLGYDCFKINDLYKETKKKEIKIAISSDLNFDYLNISQPDTSIAKIKYLSYTIEKIHNPVWLPTVSQIYNLFLEYRNPIKKEIDSPSLDLYSEFLTFWNKTTIYKEISRNTTLEQLWLYFFMYENFQKVFYPSVGWIEV